EQQRRNDEQPADGHAALPATRMPPPQPAADRGAAVRLLRGRNGKGGYFFSSFFSSFLSPRRCASRSAIRRSSAAIRASPVCCSLPAPSSSVRIVFTSAATWSWKPVITRPLLLPPVPRISVLSWLLFVARNGRSALVAMLALMFFSSSVVETNMRSCGRA